MRLLAVFVLLASIARADVYGPTTFYGDVRVGTWGPVQNVTHTVDTNGATAYQTEVTVYTRVSATNSLGQYIPFTEFVGTVLPADGKAHSVVLGWDRYDGIRSYIVEMYTDSLDEDIELSRRWKSVSAGSTGTVCLTVSDTNWIAIDPMLYSFEDGRTPVPVPDVPWSGSNPSATCYRVGFGLMTNCNNVMVYGTDRMKTDDNSYTALTHGHDANDMASSAVLVNRTNVIIAAGTGGNITFVHGYTESAVVDEVNGWTFKQPVHLWDGGVPNVLSIAGATDVNGKRGITFTDVSNSLPANVYWAAREDGSSVQAGDTLTYDGSSWYGSSSADKYSYNYTNGTSVVANAAFSCVNVELTNDVTIFAPTNAPCDGKKVQFRLYAIGADRTVYLDTGLRIPSCSSLTSYIVVSNGTASVLLLDKNAYGNNYWVESYVWGY